MTTAQIAALALLTERTSFSWHYRQLDIIDKESLVDKSALIQARSRHRDAADGYAQAVEDICNNILQIDGRRIIHAKNEGRRLGIWAATQARSLDPLVPQAAQ